DVLDLDLGAGVVCLVDGLSGHDVLQLRADERAALAGLDVLELHDAPELSVDLDDDAVPDICGGCHAGASPFVSKVQWPGAEARDEGPSVDSIGCRAPAGRTRAPAGPRGTRRTCQPSLRSNSRTASA